MGFVLPITTPAPRVERQPQEDAPNVVWAVDFQFDATTDGRPIKIVSIVDEHTRECPGGLVERNITGRHLIDELGCLAVDRALSGRAALRPPPRLARMAAWWFPIRTPRAHHRQRGRRPNHVDG